MRESGAAVQDREVEVAAWQRADGTRARLDVAYQVEGASKYVDVTIRHPLASKYVARASILDGAAAEIAETAKRTRYPANAAAGLLAAEPFAIETFGRLGPAALQVLHEARQRAIERDDALRGWAGSALFQRWLGLLSCTLIRSLFHVYSAAIGAACPRVELEDADRGHLALAALEFAAAPL